jgi:hypothetical protein
MIGTEEGLLPLSTWFFVSAKMSTRVALFFGQWVATCVGECNNFLNSYFLKFKFFYFLI